MSRHRAKARDRQSHAIRGEFVRAVNALPDPAKCAHRFGLPRDPRFCARCLAPRPAAGESRAA